MLHEVSSDQAKLLGALFPHLEGLEFVGVEAGGGRGGVFCGVGQGDG